MAASIRSIDTDVITLRQINVRSATNGFIPARRILISDGAGTGYWDSVSSVSTVPFDTLSDSYGSTFVASNVGNIIPFYWNTRPF